MSLSPRESDLGKPYFPAQGLELRKRDEQVKFYSIALFNASNCIADFQLGGGQSEGRSGKPIKSANSAGVAVQALGR
jgi:hypothetical protein